MDPKTLTPPKKKKVITKKPSISKKVKKPIDKKKRSLTIKQRKFIDEVVKTGNATDAAMKVYKCKNREVAKSVWPENLAKPCIKEAIEDRLKVAKDMIYIIATTAKKEEIRLRACQDIIDRWEWKPRQVVENLNTNTNIDAGKMTDEKRKAIADRLKTLD